MDAMLSNKGTWLAEPITERDHAIGPPTAPVTIVEYGDYECPDCLNAVGIMEEVRQGLGDQLHFIFRHYPQSSVHPHASAAAEAAEAAADQGKFWEMHKALFRHQKELVEIDFSHLALTLGLEIYKFEISRTLEQHHRHIQTDFEGGVRSGVKKTPTLFVNGLRYDGPIDAKSIIATCKSALAQR
jgi:protein-disulfide isomerase